MDVAKVTGDEIGEDLPVPVRHQLVAKRPAFQEQEHLAGPLALPNQRCAGFDAPGVGAELIQSRAIRDGQGGEILELAGQEVRHGARLPQLNGAAIKPV